MFRKSPVVFMIAAVLVLGFVSHDLAGDGLAKGNPNPKVLPIHSVVNGKTYGEWAAAWWQWAFSIPADRSPLIDDSGDFCGEGQSGPVWFYASNFGWDAEKYCTVPAGKKIFMPVYMWIFGESVWDCGATSDPYVECDVETLRAMAAENVLAADVLEVSIDGVPLQSIADYRALSPEPFTITYPEGSVTGVDAGDYYPNVTDGFWLMLTPLTPGEHTIRTYVYAPDTPYAGTIEYEVITHLTVVDDDDDDGDADD